MALGAENLNQPAGTSSRRHTDFLVGQSGIRNLDDIAASSCGPTLSPGYRRRQGHDQGITRRGPRQKKRRVPHAQQALRIEYGDRRRGGEKTGQNRGTPQRSFPHDHGPVGHGQKVDRSAQAPGGEAWPSCCSLSRNWRPTMIIGLAIRCPSSRCFYAAGYTLIC